MAWYEDIENIVIVREGTRGDIKPKKLSKIEREVFGAEIRALRSPVATRAPKDIIEVKVSSSGRIYETMTKSHLQDYATVRQSMIDLLKGRARHMTAHDIDYYLASVSAKIEFNEYFANYN